jgi:hypothetical protein
MKKYKKVIKASRGPRWATNRLLSMADDGVVSWQSIAEAALVYMSDDQVRDMAESNGFFDEYEEE